MKEQTKIVARELKVGDRLMFRSTDDPNRSIARELVEITAVDDDLMLHVRSGRGQMKLRVAPEREVTIAPRSGEKRYVLA